MKRSSAYPVKQASSTQPSPGQPATRLDLYQVVDGVPLELENRHKLRDGISHGIGRELGRDESLDARGHGGVDHGLLIRETGHADGGDDGVLVAEGGREGGQGPVFEPAHGDASWKGGIAAGEDRDGEGGIGGGDEGLEDGGAEVTGGLDGVGLMLDRYRGRKRGFGWC